MIAGDHAAIQTHFTERTRLARTKGTPPLSFPPPTTSEDTSTFDPFPIPKLQCLQILQRLSPKTFRMADAFINRQRTTAKRR